MGLQQTFNAFDIETQDNLKTRNRITVELSPVLPTNCVSHSTEGSRQTFESDSSNNIPRPFEVEKP